MLLFLLEKSSSGIASKARFLMQIVLFFFIRSNIYRVLYGDKADKGLLETDGANWSDDRGENGSHATAVGYEIEQEMTET